VNYITANDMVVGIHRPFTTTATFPDAIIGYTDGADVNGYAYHANTGNKFNNGSTAYGASYTAGDVIGVALDMSTAGSASITFYKNNTSQGVAFSGLTGDFFPCFSATHASAASINFGQRPFTYTPPTGFKALNTQNLPEPVIKKGNQWFDATTYTGNGTSQNVLTPSGFQPDLVWFKSRNNAASHALFDSVRGANQGLYSNLTLAEGTWSGQTFLSNGFTVNATYSGENNTNGNTYVGWQWKEGATPGFDVVTYTGDGTSPRNISHSLGAVPAMVIVKSRGATSSWIVKHKSLSSNNVLFLEATNAQLSPSNGYVQDLNNSSTFGVVNGGGGVANVNTNGTAYVAYLFAEVAGFSRFGSYTGNLSTDGPFVFCGFKPRFVMVKMSSSAGEWYILDSARDPSNVQQQYLMAQSSAAEGSAVFWDSLSNGFKIRSNTTGVNASGGTYIYAAFAETAFKFSLSR
jgi:hypothetical protein